MRQFRKRMLANGLALSVVLSSLPTTYISATEKSNVKFSDVKGHWSESFINDFTNKGYINGYGDGTFRPDKKVTRAEFVKVVNMVFGFTQKGNENFSDLNKDDWYYDEVLKAVKQGYINGYEDGTFRPNDEITREEACKIIGVILEVSGDGKTKFKDEKEISDWAIKYVDGLVDKGIIHGYEDNTFKPKDNSTRAESVKILYGAKDKYNSDESVPPVINPTPPSVEPEQPVDPDDELLNPDNPKWNTDSDNDGLLDAEEELYKSNPNNPDTDGDGLGDKFEFDFAFDFTKSDSDDNGILDGEEDVDLDGITNIEEQRLGTNPILDDTDLDGIKDKDEINIYNTNPTKEDSDGDGLSDGNELLLGSDPNLVDSNNDGTSDFESKYNIDLKCSDLESDDALEVNVIGNISGKNINDIKMTNMEDVHESIHDGIQGYIGAPYKISIGYEIPIKDIKIKFKIYSDTIRDKNIQNPIIYGYSEGSYKLEKVDTTKTTDEDGNIYVESNFLSKYSTYVVLDSSKLNNDLIKLKKQSKNKIVFNDTLLLKTADASYIDLVGKKNTKKVELLLDDPLANRQDIDSLNIVHANNPTWTGFGGIAFKKGTTLVISYAGSNDPVDWAGNLVKLPKYGQHPQVNNAKRFLEEAIKKAEESSKSEINRIYISGHSLGGYLTQNMIARCKQGDIKGSEGKEIRGATFNTAPFFSACALEYDTVLGIRLAMKTNCKEWQNHGFHSSTYNNIIRNYHIEGDTLLEYVTDHSNIQKGINLGGMNLAITKSENIFPYKERGLGLDEHALRNFYFYLNDGYNSDDNEANSDEWKDWELTNSSYVNEHNELVLTEDEYWQVGTAWYKKEVSLPFTAEFDYLAGAGTGTYGGADGFVFMFNKDKEYTPVYGANMGFSNGDNVGGYGVEFDSSGSEWNQHDPVEGEHVAIIKDNVDNHISEVKSNPRVEDGIWHRAKIVVDKDYINVYIDNELVITYTEEFDNAYSNIGFGAGTGSGNNWHKIRNFSIKGEIQKEKKILKGKVTDGYGNSIVNSNVILKNKNDGKTYSTKTDLDGNYKFINIPKGEYRLTAKLSSGSKYTYKDIGIGDDYDMTINLEIELNTLSNG